ncbi:MAG: hypothetical protein AB7H97_20795 [Pseudobdellovibrionaceae bacterium]
MKTITILFAMLLTACASSSKEGTSQAALKVGEPKKMQQTSIEAKQLGAENEASNIVEFKFVKGKDSPGPRAEKKINSLLAKTYPDRTQKIMILTWSDQKKSGWKLAERRAESIASYFKDYKVSKHNMMEKPGKIASWLGTQDARVKKSLAENLEGAPKLSSAMIFVIPKEP